MGVAVPRHIKVTIWTYLFIALAFLTTVTLTPQMFFILQPPLDVLQNFGVLRRQHTTRRHQGKFQEAASLGILSFNALDDVSSFILVAHPLFLPRLGLAARRTKDTLFPS